MDSDFNFMHTAVSLLWRVLLLVNLSGNHVLPGKGNISHICSGFRTF